jgi:hypothetical protein
LLCGQHDAFWLTNIRVRCFSIGESGRHHSANTSHQFSDASNAKGFTGNEVALTQPDPRSMHECDRATSGSFLDAAIDLERPDEGGTERQVSAERGPKLDSLLEPAPFICTGAIVTPRS